MTEEIEPAAYCSSDNRSAIRKLWEKATYHPVTGGTHFLARGVVVFSLLDRVMILFGRDVEVIVSTEHELDISLEVVHKAIDTLRIEAGTTPRCYR